MRLQAQKRVEKALKNPDKSESYSEQNHPIK